MQTGATSLSGLYSPCIMTLTTQAGSDPGLGISSQHQVRSGGVVAVENCPLCETNCRNGYYCAKCVNSGKIRHSKAASEDNPSDSARELMKEIQQRSSERKAVLAEIERRVQPDIDAVSRRARLEFLQRECEQRKAQIASLQRSLSERRAEVNKHQSMLQRGEQKKTKEQSKLTWLTNHLKELREKRDRERSKLENLSRSLESERRARATQLLKFVFAPVTVVPSCSDEGESALCFFCGTQMDLNVSLIEVANALYSKHVSIDDSKYVACAFLARELCNTFGRLFDMPSCDVPLQLFLSASMRFQMGKSSRSAAVSVTHSKSSNSHKMNKPVRQLFRAVSLAAQKLACFALSYVRGDEKVTKALSDLATFTSSPIAVLRNLYVAVQLLSGNSPIAVLQTLQAAEGQTPLSVLWGLETLSEGSSDADAEPDVADAELEAGALSFAMHRSTINFTAPRAPLVTRNRSVSVTKLEYTSDFLNAQRDDSASMDDGSEGLSAQLGPDDERCSRPPPSDWCVVEDEHLECDKSSRSEDEETTPPLQRNRRTRAATECESASFSPSNDNESETRQKDPMPQSMFASFFSAFKRS